MPEPSLSVLHLALLYMSVLWFGGYFPIAHATWRTQEFADSPARGYTRY